MESINISPDKELQNKHEDSFPNPCQIDSTRVTVGKELYESVKCSLCCFLCFDPHFMCCCDTLFCKQCIRVFLSENKKCPQCKLPDPKFKEPTKFMNKIFFDLRISCKYSPCVESNLHFSSVLEHEKFCEFNPDGLKKCEECLIFFNKKEMPSHSCLDELIKVFEKVKLVLKEAKENLEKEKDDELIQMLRAAKKLHSHPMIKTKRRANWICEVCGSKNNPDQYSIYCCQCDFDICTKCFDKTLDKEGDNNAHSLHSLKFMRPHGNWGCDLCKTSYNQKIYSFRCETCNWDQCFSCRFK